MSYSYLSQAISCSYLSQAYYNWAIAISDRAKIRGRTKEAEELWKQVSVSSIMLFALVASGAKRVFSLVLKDERHLSSSSFLYSVSRCTTLARTMVEDMRSYSELLSHWNSRFGIILNLMCFWSLLILPYYFFVT